MIPSEQGCCASLLVPAPGTTKGTGGAILAATSGKDVRTPDAHDDLSRLVVMRAGRIVLDGTPEEVFAESEWPVLASTFLEPTLAARVGAQRGLGSTPTEASLIAALQVRGGSA